MQNQSILSSPAPMAVVHNAGASLQTDQTLSALVENIASACCDQASLIPHAVRQALDEGINVSSTQKLIREILALPRAGHGYTRHILYADPKGRFTMVALVWQTNQCSPIHAHYTWCAYKVLSGLLTESHFEWDRTHEKVALSGQVQRPAGQSVCGHAGLELIHQLGNRHADTAVSIHVYGMDVERISTHVNRVLVQVDNA